MYKDKIVTWYHDVHSIVYSSRLKINVSAMHKIVIGKAFCVILFAELHPFQSLQKQYFILGLVRDPGFQKSLFLAGKQ